MAELFFYILRIKLFKILTEIFLLLSKLYPHSYMLSYLIRLFPNIWVILDWPHKWGLLVFLYYALLTLLQDLVLPSLPWVGKLQVSFCWDELWNQRDFLVLYLHFIWVAKHKGDYSGLSPAKTKVQMYKYFCVWQSFRIHIFLYMAMGVFAASCRLVANRAGREEKSSNIHLPQKVELWEERGKDATRF